MRMLKRSTVAVTVISFSLGLGGVSALAQDLRDGDKFSLKTGAFSTRCPRNHPDYPNCDNGGTVLLLAPAGVSRDVSGAEESVRERSGERDRPDSRTGDAPPQ